MKKKKNTIFRTTECTSMFYLICNTRLLKIDEIFKTIKWDYYSFFVTTKSKKLIVLKTAGVYTA